MPVKYSKEKGKWCFGDNCTFSSKESAEKAQEAYHAKKGKDVKKEKIIITEDDYDIQKATFEDVKGLLRNAIREKFIFENGYFWDLDYDSEFVYFEVDFYEYNNGQDRYYSIIYKLPYTLDGVTVSLGQDLVKVEKETKYTEVKDKATVFYESGDVNRSMEFAEGIISKVLKRLGVKDKEKEISDVVEKDGNFYIEKFKEEEQISYEPLYTSPDVSDAVGEGMTEEESLKMVKQIKEKIEKGEMQANLFHKVPTESFEWIDCFSNPWPSCYVGDQEVLKSQPVGILKWHNKEAWELRKAGVILGPSIEGKAGNRRRVENTND